MAAPDDRPTSITVPGTVRRRLRDYQVDGKSVAKAIEDLMDHVPPEYFRRDLHRALAAEPRLGLAEFRRKHRLAGRYDTD
ncbi:MAG: hypothetical protein L3J77_03605 [Thermoplasmata archaeon]|nr:hypothetical protein [Thermoplasmata archaeon]